MKLTDLKIKKLKEQEKVYRVSDGKGLSIEVSPKGTKSWRYRYRLNDKQQITGLGKYPIVGLNEARKRRDEAESLVEQGKSPSREKKAAKLKSLVASENTFEVIARRWLELKHADLNQKYREQCLTRMEQHVFPMIGDLPISEITIPDVVRVIEKIAERGTIETAKRMKQIISQTFRYASQRGLCTHNPAADLRDILPTKEIEHHKCVPISELPELLQAIEGYKGDRLVVLMMKLFSLTCLRTQEVIGAKWDEIDFNRAEWNVPKERMKMKRSHMVPLSKQALKIFNEIKTINGNREFIFFSGRSKSKHLSNGTVLMALKRMGYKGRMTGHGFRTVGSTILNERGYNKDWIERQLAHGDEDKIRASYNKANYVLERKKMMQDYADILDEIRKNKDNIIIKEFG